MYKIAGIIKMARYGAGVLISVGNGDFLLEENTYGDQEGKLRPVGGGAQKGDWNLDETITRELGEELSLEPDEVLDRIYLIGYIPDGDFKGCGMYMLDAGGLGLTEGTYQANNSDTEVVKLVRATLDHPEYIGKHPEELLREQPADTPGKYENTGPEGIDKLVRYPEQSDRPGYGYCPSCGFHSPPGTSRERSSNGKTTCGLCGHKEYSREWQPVSEPNYIQRRVKAGSAYELLDVMIKEADDEEELPVTGPRAIMRALRKLDVERVEQDAWDDVRSGKVTRRKPAVDKLRILDGLKRNEIKPSDLMLDKVPVVPAKFRPFTFIGETFIPGDTNELYQDMINMLDTYRDTRELLGDSGVEDLNLDLYDSVSALFGYGEPVMPKTRQRGVSGFLDKVISTGRGPKFSMMQRKLTSKPQDFVGRGVITPDPDMGLDSLGIPEELAWTTFAPYIQRRLTRRGIRPTDAVLMVDQRTDDARRELLEELKVRPVMYSRAPAWHKYSVLGGWGKLIDTDTIKVNPYVTTGLGADFDGDFQVGKVLILRKIQPNLDNFNNTEKSCLPIQQSDGLLQSTFKDTAIPYYDTENYVLQIADLEDFPHGDFSNHVDGKNGPIDFYNVRDTYVVAYDESTGLPKWVPVEYYSKHYKREVEIVNLHTGRQIITDDDPRAVYGIDPNAETLTPGRFTPSAALERGVLVPFVRSTENLASTAEELTEVTITEDPECAFGTLPLSWDIGYLFGAFCGDGWWDKKDNSYYAKRTDMYGTRSLHLADLKEYNANRVLSILETFPKISETIYYHKNTTLKKDHPDRYGDTIHHSYNFRHSEYLSEFFTRTMGGSRSDTSAGAAHKHIPNFVLQAPREFRKGLFAGLIDTDGTVSASNAKSKPQLMIAFTSTSLRLVRDVQFLASTLGIRGHICWSKKTSGGNDCWIVSLSAPDCKRVGGLEKLACPWKRDAFVGTSVSQTGGNSGSANGVVLPRHVSDMLMRAIGTPKITKELRDRGGVELDALKDNQNQYAQLHAGSRVGWITKQAAREALKFLRMKREQWMAEKDAVIREINKHGDTEKWDWEINNRVRKVVSFLAPFHGDKVVYKNGQRLNARLARPLKEGTISKKLATRLIEALAEMEPPVPVWEHPEIVAWLELVKNESISWVYVKSIQKTGIRETGYDLTVPGYETFMSVDGVILSNTLNIHVPSQPEVVEEVKERLMPSKMIFSEKQRGSIMNPPKHEQILGLYTAKNRPTDRRHQFSSEQEALRAIDEGTMRMSDEYEIIDPATDG